MISTAWMRNAASGIADNLGGVEHDGKDVSCELRNAANEIDRLHSGIREIEKTMMAGAGLMATAMLAELVETLPTPKVPE